MEAQTPSASPPTEGVAELSAPGCGRQPRRVGPRLPWEHARARREKAHIVRRLGVQQPQQRARGRCGVEVQLLQVVAVGGGQAAAR